MPYFQKSFIRTFFHAFIAIREKRRVAFVAWSMTAYKVASIIVLCFVRAVLFGVVFADVDLLHLTATYDVIWLVDELITNIVPDICGYIHVYTGFNAFLAFSMYECI